MTIYKEKYQQWIEDNNFDTETKKELKKIENDEKEIEDRFYKDLEFGTGGLRGVIGAGTNRMNVYTVRKATQGLANYIIKCNGNKKGVAIAYDSRIMSKEFSEEAALCLNANGIATYRFSSLRPTPELSFAVRELGCIAGIVITASHNPAEYNGYKVYWEDGAQITSPKDKEIIAEVNKVSDYKDVKFISRNEAIDKGLFHIIGNEIDDRYMEELKKLIIQPELIHEMADSLRIVYTPLHGTGNIPVRRILNELGFSQVFVVEEQEKPDGLFPTVSYPNPEDPRAFKMALKLAEEKHADIILATDPDADRLGVYAKDGKTGKFINFSGNMSGVLIADYILSQKKKRKQLPADATVVTTIVSTNMLKAIAKANGIHCVETLTGFKYIGEQIKIFEQNQVHHFMFGMEESYGCLVGTYARDKDAVSAVMALCEVAAFCKKQDKTLWDRMLELYTEYGYYRESLESLTLKGVDGIQKIQNMMCRLREDHPACIGNIKVKAFRDYQRRIRIDCITGHEQAIELPESNVLYFELADDAWCCIRPSGTEPKIKVYIGVKGNNILEADHKLSELKIAIFKLLKY